MKPHFFGDKSAPLYGVYDEPRGSTDGSLAVLACYPIAGEYKLEISSPGIDRPLVRLKDFERFKGFEAKIEIKAPFDNIPGQRRFKGRLLGVDGNKVQVECDHGLVALEYENIASAKLILTDALVAASLRAR